MNKLMSALAAIATVATVPAVSAIPASANAAVRVVVGAPGAGFYFYNGRHYRHRVWRNTAWSYYDPIVVSPGYGYAPAYGYGYAPSYGYAPAYGYRYGGARYYGHRSPRHVRCFYGRHGQVCR